MRFSQHFLRICLLLFLFMLLLQCKNSEQLVIAPILINSAKLEHSFYRIKNEDPQIIPALEQLIAEAEVALTEGPFSVTHKEKLPPSGDKHDYASYSRYWWPDPATPDGLPYLRKDGETNPDSQNLTTSDRPRIGAFGKNAETLGLAYFFTKDERYALKVAELLKVWFLDEETRMNPNVKHAQCRLGHNQGSKTGILDGRLIVKALEGSLLISGSGAMNAEEMEGLRSWTVKYFHWLTTNNMALEESASHNNHGSFYDAQAMYLALYSGQEAAAKLLASKAHQNRILKQIEPDGSMPNETTRTKPLFYSIYNLHALYLVAALSERVGVDIWLASNTGSRLRKALDYILPYADPKVSWPAPTLGECDRMHMLPLLYMASHAYSDNHYVLAAKLLPVAERQAHRSNLVFPLMR